MGEVKINGVPKRVVVFDYGLLDIVDHKKTGYFCILFNR